MKCTVAHSPSFVTALVLSSAPAFAGDREGEGDAGKLAFNNSCRTCHSVDEGDNRLGPNLHAIIGREAGSEDYKYSPAMAGSDVVWDAETLDQFIENPEAFIPGNNMKPYGGISDATTRASIVAYLSDASGDGDDEGEADEGEADEGEADEGEADEGE